MIDGNPPEAAPKPVSSLYVQVPLSVAQRMALSLNAMAAIMREKGMSTAPIVQEDANFLTALALVERGHK